jgi:hypothetical protein
MASAAPPGEILVLLEDLKHAIVKLRSDKG